MLILLIWVPLVYNFVMFYFYIIWNLYLCKSYNHKNFYLDLG